VTKPSTSARASARVSGSGALSEVSSASIITVSVPFTISTGMSVCFVGVNEGTSRDDALFPISLSSSIVLMPRQRSGQYRRAKNPAALYLSIRSGSVCHLDPLFPNHPSAFAIAIETSGPSTTSLVSKCFAQATHALVSPCPLMRNCNGL